MTTSTEKMFFLLGMINIRDILMPKLEDCLVLSRVIQEPLYYQINDEEKAAFEIRQFRILLQELLSLEKENFKIILSSQDTEFLITIQKQQLLFRGLMTFQLFKDNEFLIEDYLNQEMRGYGQYAYLRCYDEYLAHNLEEIALRDFDTPEVLEKLPKMYNEKREMIIDCSQLAGFDLMYQGFCFTACYKMWFSSFYDPYIPRDLFLEVQQVSQITQLKGARRALMIQLYEDPLNWQATANLKFQMLFRDQLGFDQFYAMNGIGVLREKYIEYTYYDKGVRTVQYQNNHLQPEDKKKATHFVLKNTDFVTNQTLTQRNFGQLNSLAFFPWQDDVSQKMMNYLILDPTNAVDNGLSAYDFYIREHLDISVEDEKYQKFLAILRFYIPEKCFKTLSSSALKHNFQDAEVGVLKQGENVLTLEFKKQQNHLQVDFLKTEKLEDAMLVEKEKLLHSKEEPKLFQNLFNGGKQTPKEVNK